HESTLVQALFNLIGNGLKFQPPGGVPSVQVRADRDGENVRIEVQDNGIGIAPHHQDRIFKVFERLHGPEQYAGTGIGLAIVKRSIERMGGSVKLVSAPGEGSTFAI